MTLFDAQLDEPVVEMPLIGCEYGTALEKSPDHRKESVKDRYPEGQGRKGQSDKCGGFGSAHDTG